MTIGMTGTTGTELDAGRSIGVEKSSSYAPGLTVQNLGKAWTNQKTLCDVSFEQAEGTIFGIAGDNGAGKSTLLKILASVLSRDKGEVVFRGISLDDLARWRPMIGYVPQELALDDRFSVRETLAFWAAARGFSREGRLRFLEIAVTDPLISGFLGKPIRECSSGMARRVSLIIGLLGDPLLLLLDEPFAGTDQDSRELILDRLALLRSRGRTILISGHEQELLGQLCDRVLLLRDGEVAMAEADPA
jgi:ABC-2 type transport system ATP-binding protein